MKHESAWMLVGETAFYCLCYEWYRPSREIHSWLKHYKGKMLQMSKTNKPQGSAHCIALHQAFRRKHIGEVDQWPRQQRVNYCKYFGSPKEWNVMLLPWCLRPICWGIYMSGGLIAGGGGCFWCTPERPPVHFFLCKKGDAWMQHVIYGGWFTWWQKRPANVWRWQLNRR